MALKTRKFSNLEDLNNFLVGKVVGKALPPVVYGLLGLKLKLVQPNAAEYTFVAGTRNDFGLTFAEIKSQLEGAFAALKVGIQGQCITLVSSTAAGIEFDAEPANASAAPLLGFTPSAGGKTLVYAAPSGTAPRLIQVFGADKGYGVVVEET